MIGIPESGSCVALAASQREINPASKQGRAESIVREAEMAWEHVLLEKEGAIGTITLNRPEKSNAFGGTMRQDLLEAVKDAAADKVLRVVIITGAGKSFCTGGDVDEFVSGTSRALEQDVSSERPAMSKIVLAINTMEKPVIAAVNGVAAGGGCNLALHATSASLANVPDSFRSSHVEGRTRTGAESIFFPDSSVMPRPRNLYSQETVWTRQKPSGSAWSIRWSRRRIFGCGPLS